MSFSKDPYACTSPGNESKENMLPGVRGIERVTLSAYGAVSCGKGGVDSLGAILGMEETVCLFFRVDRGSVLPAFLPLITWLRINFRVLPSILLFSINCKDIVAVWP